MRVNVDSVARRTDSTQVVDGDAADARRAKASALNMDEKEWMRRYRAEQIRRNISTAYRDHWSAWRRDLAKYLESNLFECVIGIMLVINFAVVWIESDETASCSIKGINEADCNMPVINIINSTLLVIYTLELVTRIIVYRGDMLYSSWNLFDCVIVTASIFEFIGTLSGITLPSMQAVRVFRLCRLARTVRIMELFPALYLMVMGFASAMQAMIWGFILITFTIIIWSIASVEFVRPHNDQIDHEGNEYCEEAFHSVLHAALLFFQTLIAGDSWGQCIIPVIMESPLLLIIFVTALVCIQLGFTNLVLAVVVDAATTARETDRKLKARLDSERRAEASAMLLAQFRNMDADNTGVLSINEFIAGYDRDPELRYLFDILRIDRDHVSEAFTVMDEDGSGTVDMQEFSSFVSKLQEDEPRMQMMLLKFQSNAILSKLASLQENLSRLSGEDAVKTSTASRICAPQESKSKSDMPMAATSTGLRSASSLRSTLNMAAVDQDCRSLDAQEAIMSVLKDDPHAELMDNCVAESRALRGVSTPATAPGVEACSRTSKAHSREKLAASYGECLQVTDDLGHRLAELHERMEARMAALSDHSARIEYIATAMHSLCQQARVGMEVPVVVV